MESIDDITLPGGDTMPAVGLGMWKVEKPVLPELLAAAVDTGYRHFDCACDYGNEAEVGAALADVFARGTCRREDVWLTSKLWNTFHAAEHVRGACERSLADLQLDYLDLYLIHFPIPLKYVSPDDRYPPGWVHDPDATEPKMEFAAAPLHETWAAMESLVEAGLVRNIGVCNFNTGLLRDLMAYAQVRPAMLQVELHPYLAQEKLLRYCRDEELPVTAFSPLGAGSYVPLDMAGADESVLTEPIVQEIAARHGKSAAQVALRWGLQRGTAVIPKTSRVERLAENIALADFALTSEEMAAIAALDRNRRFNDPGDFGPQAFGTFCPIYD